MKNVVMNSPGERIIDDSAVWGMIMNSHNTRLILSRPGKQVVKGRVFKKENVEMIKSVAFGTTNEVIYYTNEVIAIYDHSDVILY